MADQRRAGLITVKVNGVTFDAKGDFTYGYGLPKREAIIGADGVHGFKEVPQVAFIEGAITDVSTLDVQAVIAGTDQTVTVDFSNGKVISLRNSWFAAEGQGSTAEAEIKVRWEGAGRLQEII